MIQIDGKVIKETPKSWTIDCHAGRIVLPKSQCERTVWEHSELDSFDVPEWLAKKEELI